MSAAEARAAVDQDLVGRSFPPTAPYLVTAERLREFAAATGGSWAEGQPAPPTFPIVLAFDAMQVFLDDVGVPLHRIVHGDQAFAHERSVVPGDELVAALTVDGVRSIGGNDLVRTRSVVTDAGGALVCTATATLVHRGGAAPGDSGPGEGSEA